MLDFSARLIGAQHEYEGASLISVLHVYEGVSLIDTLHIYFDVSVKRLLWWVTEKFTLMSHMLLKRLPRHVTVKATMMDDM
jgi:hypothetical protein